MIYRILAGVFCFFSLVTEAQVLRDLNYNHIYPNAIFHFDWKVLKVDDGFKVFFELRQYDAQNPDPTIELETRGSVNEKSGASISISPVSKKEGTILGSADFQASSGQNIVVAKITTSNGGKLLVYNIYKQLPKNKSLYLLADQQVLLNPFVNNKQSVTISGFNTKDPLQISYYNISFPAAAPAFSNTQARVSKAIKPDSLFTVATEIPIQLNKKGLYLAQQDTSSTEGIAFRVEEDYPKLGTIEGLAGPLIYICTKQEGEKLKQVGNDKKKFDQLILTITGNSERARNFMRSYYRRVELANQYFSSYKEGWKTDRGMIYMIFGLPEEVYLFDDREVWDYKNNNVKVRFQFVRSPSVFDPDNYVLIREKKFTTTWYEMIDLWRKARF